MRRAGLIIAVIFGMTLIVLAACNGDGDNGSDHEEAAADAPQPTVVTDDEAVESPVFEPTETPELEPTPTAEPEPTEALGQARAADLSIDPTDLILTRDEMGDGWRRHEIMVDQPSMASDSHYCGWGEELPGWIASAETTFESTDGSFMIQYAYLFPEDEAEAKLQAFGEQITNCDVWTEDTEQGEMTTYLASHPMPNLGDDAVSFHQQMTHQSGMDLGQFVILLTRYDDLVIVMGTLQSQPLNLGYRGSEYMHLIDRKVRTALDRPTAGIGDPIRTTHGLEVTPLSVSGPESREGFPGQSLWTVEMQVCSARDGVDVNQQLRAEFDVDHSQAIPDHAWNVTLGVDECVTGDGLFLTETDDAQLRTVRYNITPAITENYGWLEWDLRGG